MEVANNSQRRPQGGGLRAAKGTPAAMQRELAPYSRVRGGARYTQVAAGRKRRRSIALGVVIAAEGYPGSYPKGMEIKGIDAVDALPDTKVFQAGTKREGSRTLSSGGRVLCVTALGKGLAEAQKRAYEAVAKIDMEKSQHRSDIGAKGLRRL